MADYSSTDLDIYDNIAKKKNSKAFTIQHKIRHDTTLRYKTATDADNKTIITKN